MLKVKAHDPRISWHGIISLEMTAEYVMPWRLPLTERGLWYEDHQERASSPAGGRIAFRTNATEITGTINAMEDPWFIDLCVDGEYIESGLLARTDTFSFAGLKPGMKVVELWLPQRRPVQLYGLSFNAGDDEVILKPWDDPKPKWITYGSSITHCANAYSPTQTWPAIVARKAGYNLTCLGYGGHEHFDITVARMIRDRPADFLSMKAGINTMSGSLNQRTFRSSVIGFVQVVREGHPDTPYAVTSPIVCPQHESTPNVHGLTLPWMRGEVREAVEIMRAHGDRNICYVDGLEIMGHDDVDLLPDAVHPGEKGNRVMGERFYEKVARPFFGAP